MLFCLVSWAGGIAGCSEPNAKSIDASVASPDAQVGWSSLPRLPEPSANNATAATEGLSGCILWSVLGIGSALDREAITRKAYSLTLGTDSMGSLTWDALPDVPGPPRLAASAASLRGQLVVLGGYEVLADNREETHDGLYRYDAENREWESLAPMPIPVDDTALVVWQDRYLITISGWRDTGNVSDVQLYDVESNTWAAATAFPGQPAFGQSAAIVGNRIVFIDGVASGPTGFRLVNQSFVATLNPDNPTDIQWSDLGSHPGPARYRAAAGVVGDALWFYGGTSEPYNFDGLRYDNQMPAEPLASILRWTDGVFAIDTDSSNLVSTMDHRNLPSCAGAAFVIGGMELGPTVSDRSWRYTSP